MMTAIVGLLFINLIWRIYSDAQFLGYQRDIKVLQDSYDTDRKVLQDNWKRTKETMDYYTEKCNQLSKELYDLKQSRKRHTPKK